MNDAYDPQWQCEGAAAMNVSFFDLPVHCQKARMETAGFEDLHPYSEKSDPGKLAPSAPPLSPHESLHGRILKYAQKATDKPSPEERQRQKEELCPPGEEPCVVKDDPPLIDRNDIPGVDASVGKDDKEDEEIKKLPRNLSEAPKEKLTDLKGLKTQFDSVMKIDNKKGTCLEKLNELLSTLGSKYKSIAEVAQRFFDRKDTVFQTKEGVQSLGQKIEGKWQKVGAPMGVTYWNITKMEIVLNKLAEGQINNFIHELVHASGNRDAYSENTIREAIEKMEGKPMGLNNFIGKYCIEGGLGQ